MYILKSILDLLISINNVKKKITLNLDVMLYLELDK